RIRAHHHAVHALDGVARAGSISRAVAGGSRSRQHGVRRHGCRVALCVRATLARAAQSVSPRARTRGMTGLDAITARLDTPLGRVAAEDVRTVPAIAFQLTDGRAIRFSSGASTIDVDHDGDAPT